MAEPMLFSALQVYSPISAFEAFVNFKQAVPFENSILQVGEDRTLPSPLNQDTLISGVPAIWHFRQTASPAVTSIGSKLSIKQGGSKKSQYIPTYRIYNYKKLSKKSFSVKKRNK